MLKFLNIGLLFSLILLLSSCLTIKEDIFLNKDGSGIAKTTLDLSEIMGLMNMFMPDSLRETLNLGEAMEADIPAYQAISGISEVKTFSEQGVYTLQYNFANENALNQALNIRNTSSSLLGQTNSKSDYQLAKRQLKRNINIDLPSDELENINLDDPEVVEMFKYFSRPAYVITYHLPQKAKKVKSQGSENKMMQNDNNVIFTYDMLNLLKAKKAITATHQIKF